MKERLQMLLSTNVVPEDMLREAQLRALELFANVVRPTYGPMGGYTTYSQYVGNDKTNVIGQYTKDGFTVLKHVNCDKPIESLIKDDIRTICTQVIKSIGDGTTSATILSYEIFKGLVQLEKDRMFPKRRIIKCFKELIKEATKRIEDRKRDCTLDDIYNIAYTSLDGNEAMANTIHDIYKECGLGVFIDVKASYNSDTLVKIYKGMVYEAGYISPCFINTADSTCELRDANVYVFESPIDTPAMNGILRSIFTEEVKKPLVEMRANPNVKITPTIVICPKISRDANSFLDKIEAYFNNIKDLDTKPRFCIVTNLNNTNNYLLDIMNLTGAKFIKKYIDNDTYQKDIEEGLAPTEDNIKSFAGKAESIIVDSISLKIINPKLMFTKNDKNELVHTDYYTNYIKNLKAELHNYEETREDIVKIGNLKRRINNIEGNLVDLFVGGIGTSDRMVLSDAVEDAVLNCRSAAVEGVCFGANYEGLKAFCNMHRIISEETAKTINEISLKYDGHFEKADYNDEVIVLNAAIKEAVAKVLYLAYENLVKQIYLPYVDYNEDQALRLIPIMIGAMYKPFNIMTEEFDEKVLTSAKTEPSILDSISRIITTLFNANQFLVPDPRFNIYEQTARDEKEQKELQEKLDAGMDLSTSADNVLEKIKTKQSDNESNDVAVEDTNTVSVDKKPIVETVDSDY